MDSGQYTYKMDWKAISEAGPKRAKVAHGEIQKQLTAEKGYICLTDILMNRDRGASAVLKQLDFIHGAKDGMLNPSESGRFRLRPKREFAVQVGRGKDAKSTYDYKPGDVIQWKQQIYSRDALGGIKGGGDKKLSRDVKEAMVRRGEGYQIYDYGKAVVDKHGLITVPYQDACQLLNNNGFVRREGPDGSAQAYAVCLLAQYSSRQIAHETEEGKLIRQTRNNWQFEEIPPWEDPAVKAPVVEPVLPEEE